jgi:hypothetical protein
MPLSFLELQQVASLSRRRHGFDSRTGRQIFYASFSITVQNPLGKIASACLFWRAKIPPRDGHPCRPANDSPCRVRRRLSLPSGCALPGAQNQEASFFTDLCSVGEAISCSQVMTTLLPQEIKLLCRRAFCFWLVLYNFWNICRRWLELHQSHGQTYRDGEQRDAIEPFAW